jgi:tripartite-type tricarboxylate transporter receptor subunit TctC
MRRLIVPTEPGGGIDAMARLLAAAEVAEGGIAPLVLNRPGASGNLGTAQTARAQPDGDTLLVTGAGHLTAPRLLANPGYDPLADFSPLCRLALAPNVVLVADGLQRVPLAISKSDQPALSTRPLAYGSAGYGHSSHLAAELLRHQTRAAWLHVPYKGTAAALRALLAGEVQMVLAPLSSAMSAMQTGKAHAVAVAHGTRLRVLADVPTLREAGVAQAEYSQWYGILMPKGASEDVLDSLSHALLRIARSAMFTAGLERMAVEPALLGRMDFERFLQAEDVRVRLLASKISLDRPRQ